MKIFCVQADDNGVYFFAINALASVDEVGIQVVFYTSSSKLITEATLELYDSIVNKDLLIRRINVCAAKLITEEEAKKQAGNVQLDFFTDVSQIEAQEKEENREKNVQKAVLGIKKRFGKNAILKGMNLQEGATAKERNEQIWSYIIVRIRRSKTALRH